MQGRPVAAGRFGANDLSKVDLVKNESLIFKRPPRIGGPKSAIAARVLQRAGLSEMIEALGSAA